MMKICIKCGAEKDESEFYKTSGNRCKTCHKAESTQRLKNNPEQARKIARDWYYRHRTKAIGKVRDWQVNNKERDNLTKFKRALVRNYNLSYEEYSRMVDEQQGKCAICAEPPTRTHLDVDHNHETGKVRQLLCSNCNTALGLLKESQELFEKATEYLIKHNNPLNQDSLGYLSTRLDS